MASRIPNPAIGCKKMVSFAAWFLAFRERAPCSFRAGAEAGAGAGAGAGAD
jgi:hypothetical protein